MRDYNDYEIVVGLEVHARLQTKSKLFCGDSTAFGDGPNTHVSPVTLAHPGTLPMMNKKAIEYAIKIGLVCDCEIEQQNFFARKNYFYPDLPKGYQLSQHTTPICKGGYIAISINGNEKKIRLSRIHLEEDAGKSIHDVDEEFTCIDLNRAGTALIEIVTEPDIRSADEAYACITEIRKLVRYLDICDGNMEEGSLRCDANISIRKKGDLQLGTRVEVKNLNSIRHIKRAVEYEAGRMMDLLDKGNPIIQQTRSFDAATGTTFAIRDKEDADDYRYFPDPDLTPFHLQADLIESIRKSIPVLQPERIKKYTGTYQLSEYDARLLTEEKNFSDYFERVIEHTHNYKAAANWMLGPVKTWLNDESKEITQFPLPATQLASLVKLVDEGKLNFSSASSILFAALLKAPFKDALQLAQELNLVQQSDADAIEPIVNEVLAKMEDKVTEYRKGKKGLLALFVGQVIRQSRGKADPKVVNEIIVKKLQS